MVKSNKKKAEKAKVKLKKGKTAPGKYLPKGTNVTKTEFKVGKIVIAKQLQQADQSGPVTRKKLGLKDVLGKLSHFSLSVRFESLEGLKELVTGEQGGNLVKANLAELVTKLCPLTSDLEAKVRRTALAILEAVLVRGEGKLEPLYDLLAAHLACSLTHIQPAIQRDGLRFIDALTQAVPRFLAEKFSHLLPICLEQIAPKKAGDDKSSSLSTSLSDKLTALEWRTDVLRRVDQILQTVVSQSQQQSSRTTLNTSLTLEFRDNLYCGLYSGSLQEPLKLTSLSSKNSDNPFISILDRVVPLITEGMVEATGGNSSRRGHLARELVPLLTSSAGILHKLLSLTTARPDKDIMLALVRTNYLDTLNKRFFVNMPFSSPEGKCHQQNLLLSSIYLTLAGDHFDEGLMEKIWNIVSTESSQAALRFRVYSQLLTSRDLSENQTSSVLEDLLKIKESLPTNSQERLEAVELLSHLAETYPQLTSWLSSIPEQLLILSGADSGEVLRLLSVLLKFAQRGHVQLAKEFIPRYPALSDAVNGGPSESWKFNASRHLKFIHENFSQIASSS